MTTNNKYGRSMKKHSYILVTVLLYASSFAQIPTSGLIAYYPFNSTANDSSGNGINGTIVGATTTSDRFGNRNAAYSFNGVDQYIRASATSLPSGERTVSLWFKSNSVDNRPTALGYGGGTCGTSWFQGINYEGFGALSLACHCRANELNYTYTTPPTGSWHHWVITTSATGTRMYLDDLLVQANSSFVNNTDCSGKDLIIGCCVAPTGTGAYTDGNVNYFDGSIDDIRIYNRALDATEIHALFRENNWMDGELAPDSNTVLLLHMNEASGPTVVDASPGGNNGTATGTTIVDGRLGKAREFSIGNYVTIPYSASLDFGNQITIECWAYLTGYQDYGSILTKGYSLGAYSFGQHLQKLIFKIDWPTNYEEILGSSVLPLNKWIHIAVAVSGSSVKMYLNGVLDHTETMTQTIANNTEAAYVGADFPGTPEYWQGFIDELRVSNIARQPAEFDIQLPPAGVDATPLGTTINLNWHNGGGAVPLLRYRVYRGIDSNNVSLIDSTYSTAYSNNGLVIGTTYYYRISAVDTTGFESALSYAAFTKATDRIAITAVSPTAGPIGGTVTILGVGFNSELSKNVVRFGAVNASVISGSSTQLNVTVPDGATYAPITVTDTSRGLTGSSNRFSHTTFSDFGVFDTSQNSGTVDYSTAAVPNQIAISDFDGDGKPDLAIANNGDNTLYIYRGTSQNGNLSFSSPVILGASTPYGIAVSDMDGDGKPDLIFLDAQHNQVDVFRNTSTSGAISFATAISFSTGSGPYRVAIGDLDGDGKLDLAVTAENLSSSNLGVLRNTSSIGHISFATRVDFSAGSNPAGVGIVDLDGDARPELVTVNLSSNTASVLFNQSTPDTMTLGSFAQKVDFATGSQPWGLAIGDIDGDGKQDLVVSNQGDNSVSVFRNTATPGSITPGSFAARISFSAGSTPNGVAIGDVDGDAKPDMVICDYGANYITLLRNVSTAGNISLTHWLVLPTAGNITKPREAAVGDLDGDGKPDIAVVNWNQSSMRVIRNTQVASSVSSQAPNIVNVLFSGSIGQNMHITIEGNNFGSEPVSMPYTGDISAFAFGDASGSWEAGYSPDGNVVGLQYSTWTPNEITINGFGPAYGGSWVVDAGDTVRTDIIVAGGSVEWRGVLTLGDHPLPVELSSFRGTAKGFNVELGWSTESEVNNHGFEVQRMTSTNWQKIGFVEGHGVSNSRQDYTFIDNMAVFGTSSYRLKQIDRDGQFKFSQSVQVEIVVPRALTLSDNYPNPFNPSTTIDFTLPEDGLVSLMIYDMIGREVTTLVNGELKAGKVHHVKFDATKLASGVYFSRLEHGGRQLMKKLLLMR